FGARCRRAGGFSRKLHGADRASLSHSLRWQGAAALPTAVHPSGAIARWPRLAPESPWSGLLLFVNLQVQERCNNPGETPMTRFAASLLAAALTATVAGAAMAETANPSTAPVTTRTDRTTAPKEQRAEMAKRRAELRQKKADCRQQARDQKLSLRQR